MDEQIINMINKNIETLRSEVREEFKQVNKKLDSMVSKDQCQEHRANCTNATVNNEWTVKKITAYSGAVTAILTTAGTLIMTIAKAFGLI
jgi:ABC-type phosphate transport system auxiliary subunit